MPSPVLYSLDPRILQKGDVMPARLLPHAEIPALANRTTPEMLKILQKIA
jgi:hypothetical protein